MLHSIFGKPPPQYQVGEAGLGQGKIKIILTSPQPVAIIVDLLPEIRNAG